MDAIGYCGARVREEMVDIYYDGVLAVRNGMASDTPFAKLLDVVRRDRFTITIDLNLGSAEYNVFTTDLTKEYVELNMGE
jgi:glutamate N-acetyltransferase/amino-acid N-acetyltransferase